MENKDINNIDNNTRDKIRQPKKQVYICTTQQCNLRCKHCFVGKYRDKKGFFDVDSTIKWLNNLKSIYSYSNEDFYFTFFGGEPFLSRLKEMQKFIDAFPNAQFDATSNLVFLLEDKTNFILSNFYADMYGKPTIKTSWDPEIRFTTMAQYNQWKYNVEYLASKGVYVRVGICATPYLLKLNPLSVLALMKKLGVEQVDFERLTSLPPDSPLYAPYEDIDLWITKFYMLSKDTNIKVSNAEGLKQALLHNLTGCRARHCHSNVITINANGSIGTCPNQSLTTPITTIYEPIKNYVFSNAKSCLVKKECTPDNRCLLCQHYDACNGECCQLQWQNDVCPGFKNLIQHIKNELSI